MGRPRVVVDKEKFLSLHRNGLTDGAIAEALDISRPTVIRLRQEMGLDANRRRGERGPGALREDKPYHQEVQRILKRNPEAQRLLYVAAREYREAGGDPVTSFIATGTEPAPMPKAVVGPHAPDVEKLNLTHVTRVVDFEQAAERAGVVGVPGPMVFELARQLKTASLEVLKSLAMKAVQSACWVGLHQLTSDVLKRLDEGRLHLVKTWHDFWAEQKEKALAWAPVQEEKKIKLPKVIKRVCTWVSRAFTGWRGTGGGAVDPVQRRLLTAVNRC